MSLLTASAWAAKASLASTRSRSDDLPAGLFERLAGGRDRAGAHDRGIDAGGGPGGDAGERREPALLRLRFRHQHDGGGAVIDARRIAGGHGAVLREGGLQLGERFDGGAGADVLVLIDDDVALAGRRS